MGAVTKQEMDSFKIRIRSAFNLFDLSAKNAMNKRDIGTVIRYLGYFPSQQQIVQIILPQINEQQTSEQQIDDEIDYPIFEELMLQIMKDNLYPSDDEETILMAFKFIQQHFDANNDEKKKRILYKNDIVSAMKEIQSEYCLDSRELDEFL